MKEPRVNIGQSEFQDTFMVVADEITPFRKLRKIELHIKELRDALKHNEFNMRKNLVKINHLKDEILTNNDELKKIELEELEYGMEGYKQLKNDAERRLINFEKMKQQLIEETPESYWKQGFENAETEYWIEYFSRRIALEVIGQGRIGTGTIDQVMCLPEKMAIQIMKLAPYKQAKMVLISQAADREIKKINTEHDNYKIENLS